MPKFTSLIFAVLALTVHLLASSPDSPTGQNVVIKGSGYAFEISAPKGWVLDLKDGPSSGRDAELYPEKSSFSTSPTIMYIEVVSKKSPGCETVTKLANSAVEKAKKNSSNIVVSRADSLETKDHKKALVKIFAATQFLSIAYVDEDSTIITFVLRASDKRRFDNARYSLKDLIGSYKWLWKKPE